MSNQYKSNEFKKLQALWYEKLKKEEFDDIESTNPKQEERMLIRWHSFYFQEKFGHQIEFFNNRQEYYIKATHFLQTFNFESEFEKEIWNLHSRGTSVRDIKNIITKTISKTYKDEVARVIRKLKEEMSLSEYIAQLEA